MTTEAMKVTKDSNGLEFIEIQNNFAIAKIALQGGHVVWWRPKSSAQDVLWLSSNSRYEKGRSIRGGGANLLALVWTTPNRWHLL